MLQIVLIHPGSTDYDQQQRIQGTLEIPLNAQGHAEVAQVIEQLQGKGIETIYAPASQPALETAEAGKLEPPRGAVEAARNRIARPLPAGDAGSDFGRIGLAAYARMVMGLRLEPATRAQLTALAAAPPTADAEGRIDPLAWFLGGLALHADGGPPWTGWAEGLRASIPKRLVADGPGLLRMPADKVRYADGDEVLATALSALALQAPYRYAVPAAD